MRNRRSTTQRVQESLEKWLVRNAERYSRETSKWFRFVYRCADKIEFKHHSRITAKKLKVSRSYGKRNGLLAIVVATTMLACSGCSHWSAKEKVLFGTMIAANVADYSTTIRYIDIGGTESNPFLDDRPSHGNVLTFKAASVGLSIIMGEIFPQRRENIFLFNTIISGGAAVWNDGLCEKHKY